MRIGVIQATSQSAKNRALYESACRAARQADVINFGCFEGEEGEYSYLEIALEIGLLVSSGSIDFVITGCSSGQGMMLVLNGLPGLLCGYCPTPQDAFLFGRINAGNAVSVGLGYGWSGEVNLRYTLSALFDGELGCGYPPADAQRKRRDTALLKRIHRLSKADMIAFLERMDRTAVQNALRRENVVRYILQNGSNDRLIKWIEANRPV